MSVYVDGITTHDNVKGAAARWGKRWSHLTADTEGELHAFAASIGLKRAWAQKMGTRFFHYDVIPSKRALAVKNGAIEITTRQLGEILHKRRDAGIPFSRPAS